MTDSRSSDEAEENFDISTDINSSNLTIKTDEIEEYIQSDKRFLLRDCFDLLIPFLGRK